MATAPIYFKRRDCIQRTAKRKGNRDCKQTQKGEKKANDAKAEREIRREKERKKQGGNVVEKVKKRKPSVVRRTRVEAKR